MRTDNMRESENVEDRRGLGGGGMRPPMLVGGGIGGVLIVVVILLLGGNPQQLLQQMAPSREEKRIGVDHSVRIGIRCSVYLINHNE